MVKETFQIGDEAKELREKIHKSVEIKKRKIGAGEISGWLDKTLELEENLSKKLDELVERFVRLEDEVRKGKRPEAVPVYKKK
jgi:hypothetical protein